MKSDSMNFNGNISPIDKAEEKNIVTTIYRNPSQEELEYLGTQLREGKIVAIPTETVYGLGSNGLDEEAIARIYEAKGRPSDNPLILHVPNRDAIVPLVQEITSTAEKLMDAFWPGPLTIIMKKSDLVPYKATGGLETVALRCPAHRLCRDFLKVAGVPVAAPSANLSGRPSPTTGEDVYHDMKGRIEYIIDAGPCSIGVESTIVECGTDAVTILRPGGITEEDLLHVVKTVRYDKGITTGVAPKAPGMKYKHYAPEGKMKTFVGDNVAVMERIKAEVASMIKALSLQNEMIIGEQKVAHIPYKIGLLISEEVATSIEPWLIENLEKTQYMTKVYGAAKNTLALAHCFYDTLLRFNEAGVTHIFAQGVENIGMGIAVMNRMEKASSHQVFQV